MYIGCSIHSVPSLSKVAMRWSGGTKSGPPCVVTRATKVVIADLVAPSFQDGSGSACASAELARSNPVSAGITASVESSTRRLRAPEVTNGFISGLQSCCG